MKFSIIIVTYDRYELFQRCIESLNKTNTDSELEFIFVINGPDPRAEGLIKELTKGSFQILKADSVTPAEARNMALSKVTGDYVCFFDDDVIVPKNYFSILEHYLSKYPKVDVLGGPDRCYPDATTFEKALGIALGSPLSTATTRFRHKSMKPGTSMPGKELFDGKESHLILCNLVANSDLFKKEGFKFDSDFFRNEENILIYQLEKQNKTIKYCPELFVYHKRKSELKGLLRAVFSSSRHRLRSFIKYPGSLSPIYFAPMVFVLYLAYLPFSSSPVFGIPLGIYLVLSFLVSFQLALTSKALSLLFPIMGLQIMINLSYGAGFLFEIFSFRWIKIHKITG